MPCVPLCGNNNAFINTSVAVALRAVVVVAAFLLINQSSGQTKKTATAAAAASNASIAALIVYRYSQTVHTCNESERERERHE